MASKRPRAILPVVCDTLTYEKLADPSCWPGGRGARGANSWVVFVKESWTSLLSQGMMPSEKAVAVEFLALDKALVKVWRVAASP